MFAVSDDVVTEDWLCIVFRWGFWFVGRSYAIVAGGQALYIGSFNQAGDTLRLRPSSMGVRGGVYVCAPE